MSDNKFMGVDLNAIKSFVNELENSLAKAQELSTSNKQEALVELAKAMGLASAASQESALLVLDIGTLITGPVKNPSKAEVENLIELFKGAKSSAAKKPGAGSN